MSDKMREEFEHWYIENIIDYVRAPIGSRECALQWKAWQAALASQPVQASKNIAEKALVWFSALDKCSRLLKMPDDQAIMETPILLMNVLDETESLKAENAALKERVAELENKWLKTTPPENEGEFLAAYYFKDRPHDVMRRVVRFIDKDVVLVGWRPIPTVIEKGGAA